MTGYGAMVQIEAKTTPKNKWLVVGLLMMGLGVGMVNLFLIPPFMNPDEIQHFIFSANYAYSEKELKELDKAVLRLLKEYKWFHFIGIGPGWEKVERIEDIYFIKNFKRENRSISRTYFHLIYGKILKITGIKDPLIAFYFLRILSFLLYIIILILSLFFYKKYFPKQWIYLMVGQLLVFQLCTILNSINYDVLLTVLGVLFFMLAYQYTASENKIHLVLLIIIAVLTALVKTAGLLFFVYFFILLMFRFKFNPLFLKRFSLVFLAFVLIFCWANFLFPDRFFILYSVIFAKLKLVGNSLASRTATTASLGFFDSIFNSFYFHTGWMGFKLNGFWYTILKIFFILSMAGIFMTMFKGRVTDMVAQKKWLLFSLIALVIQLLSIRLYYGTGSMAQGRYLYPLIIPVMMLIYSGLAFLNQYLGLKRDYLLVSYIIFQALFLIFAIIKVVSVFYLEVASPHIGL
jgi:hypothetical protein